MYATLDELRDWLRIHDDDDDVDDDQLTMAIQVASASIDHLCSQTFPLLDQESLPTTVFAVPVQNRVTGVWTVDMPPTQDPFSSVVTIWTEEEGNWSTVLTLPESAYKPFGGPVYDQIVLPDDSGYDPGPDPSAASAAVTITASFGYSEIPRPVVQACLIQASRIVARRDAKFGIVNSLDGSSQARLRASIDNDVAVMLRGYIKYWAAR